MDADAITDLVTRQEWIAPIEQGLQKAVAGTFSAAGPTGQRTENFLHGTWLGHPLHPVLTDIPLGAWTAAAALDIVDAVQGNRKGSAADVAVAAGLVGAAGAALTGLTDWHKTDGKARRVGLAHGLLNVGATTLFFTSWLLRRRKAREAARIVGWIGYAVACTAAYLGGSLVYREKIGVDHADRQTLPDGFTPVLPEAELPENVLHRVEVGGINILLVRQGERIYALSEVCSHLGGPLAEGQLEDSSVRCPWHGSRFCLEEGRVLDGPATFPQSCYETRVRSGKIEVRMPSASPALSAAPKEQKQEAPVAI